MADFMQKCTFFWKNFKDIFLSENYFLCENDIFFISLFFSLPQITLKIKEWRRSSMKHISSLTTYTECAKKQKKVQKFREIARFFDLGLLYFQHNFLKLTHFFKKHLSSHCVKKHFNRIFYTTTIFMKIFDLTN